MSDWFEDTIDYVPWFTRWDVAPAAHKEAFIAWLQEPVDFRLSEYFGFVFSEVGHE